MPLKNPFNPSEKDKPDDSYKGLARRGVEIGEESLKLQQESLAVLRAMLSELTILRENICELRRRT